MKILFEEIENTILEKQSRLEFRFNLLFAGKFDEEGRNLFSCIDPLNFISDLPY